MARPQLGIPQNPTTIAFGDAADPGSSGQSAALANHRHGMPADPVTAHAAAADPHTGYQQESEKDQTSGYVGINGVNQVALPGSLVLSSSQPDTRLRRFQAGRLTMDSNGAASPSELGVLGTAGQRAKLDIRVGTDGNARAEVYGDATMAGILLGDGTAAPDTNLYRSAANVLKTDDTLEAVGGVTVGGVPLAKSVVPIRRLYTTPGTTNWTHPAGLLYIEVEVQGAGGGGGGNPATATGQGSSGGGGAGGGYAKRIITAAELTAAGKGVGQTCGVTVGSGGAGGIGNNPGSTGGRSEFAWGTGTIIIAWGGDGGSSITSAANSNNSPGGTGGTSTGDANTLTLTGSGGGRGGTNAGLPTAAGHGGHAHLGGGGRGERNGNGMSGMIYGGGGGGSSESGAGGAAHNGGYGAQGVAIITEYYA